MGLTSTVTSPSPRYSSRPAMIASLRTAANCAVFGVSPSSEPTLSAKSVRSFSGMRTTKLSTRSILMTLLFRRFSEDRAHFIHAVHNPSGDDLADRQRHLGHGQDFLRVVGDGKDELLGDFDP